MRRKGKISVWFKCGVTDSRRQVFNLPVRDRQVENLPPRNLPPAFEPRPKRACAGSCGLSGTVGTETTLSRARRSENSYLLPARNRASNPIRSRGTTRETPTGSAESLGAGIASQHFSVRLIGAASGVLSSSTAIFWAWANWTGKLPEPELMTSDELVEIHGDPTA